MGLKAVYATQEDIPEGLQDYYKETADGSFKIELEGGVKTQADVDRVKASLEKQREQNEELTRKLSKMPEDFDPDKWDALKDMDPENLPKGGKIDPKDEQEFNRRVAEAVRDKEREIKEANEQVLAQEKEKLKQKEQAFLDRHKKDFIKTKLAERHGFSDQKRLRWFLMDIENGELPELKRHLETINVIEDNGKLTVVGGDLKDADGALEVIDRIANKTDVVKDYKPASDNGGGGTPPPGGGGEGSDIVKKLKKPDGRLNITLAGKLYSESQEKARNAVRQAGFDPDKVFKT
jgi:hypothetical protein